MGGISLDMLAMPFQATHFVIKTWWLLKNVPNPPDVNYRVIVH